MIFQARNEGSWTREVKAEVIICGQTLNIVGKSNLFDEGFNVDKREAEK